MAIKRELLQEDVSYVNALRYGATPIAQNEATIQAAVTALGSTPSILFLTPGTWTIATPTVIPSTITLWPSLGSTVQIGAGVVLTLNSPPRLEQPVWHTGTGTLTLNYGTVNVRDLSTAGLGTSASPWTGWDTALTSWAGTTRYDFPAGHFRWSTPLTLSGSRTHIRGEGKQATILHFEPTVNWTIGAFNFNATSGLTQFQSSIQDLSILSANTTLGKVGVGLVDVNEFHMKDVAVGTPAAWFGNAQSRGVWIHGATNTVIEQVNLSGDIPLQLSANPNSSVGVYHLVCRDTVLTQTNAAGVLPCVYVDVITVQHLTIEGHNVWTNGNNGLFWFSNLGTSGSHSNVIKNVLWTGSPGSGRYMFDIQMSGNTMFGLRIENCYCANGSLSNGYLFRGIVGLVLQNVFYTGSGIALNVDTSCSGLSLLGCYWILGSTASLGGLTAVWAASTAVNGFPIPSDAVYAY